MEKLQKPLRKEPFKVNGLTIYVCDEGFSDKLDGVIWNDPEKFAGQKIVTVSPELLPKIFSPERLRLLKALEKKPKNMGDLVKILDRPREAVSRDISYLKGMGFIEISKNGKERVPSRAGPITIEM